MKLSHAAGAAFAAAFVALSSHSAQAQPFTPGQCVTINGAPSHIIGPSPTVPGLILAQDDRPNSSVMAWRPDQIKPAPCPGPKTVKAECFPSDPDSNGRTPLEQQVRGAWRENWAHTNQHYNTHFRSVTLGQWRPWTVKEQLDIADGDRSKPVMTVRIDFDTCEDNGTFIETVHRVREAACYTSTVTGQLICGGAVSSLGSDSTIKQVPKY